MVVWYWEKTLRTAVQLSIVCFLVTTGLGCARLQWRTSVPSLQGGERCGAECRALALRGNVRCVGLKLCQSWELSALGEMYLPWPQCKV